MNGIDFGLFTFTLTAGANQGEKLVALAMTGKIKIVDAEKFPAEPNREVGILNLMLFPLDCILGIC